MNSLKIVALVVSLALTACGSREWRANQGNKARDLNTDSGKAHPYYNSQDPAALELLKSIGGASLSVPQASGDANSASAEAKDAKSVFAKLEIVLKGDCEYEHFVQELPLDTGVSNGLEAQAVRSTDKNEQEGHGWLESRCIGKDGSCDQVSILFRHFHEGKRAETTLNFSKNSQGKYSIVPVQNSGVMVMEAEEYLKVQAEKMQSKQCEDLRKQKEEAEKQPVLNDK
ncbi:MAG: hypothetical protein A4S09_06885 [Proteobacteria bacterium SG_bin7]|nr:MAG: hypothetical protein A4S09_06885 [Proteobacteria bacterium SG_bin7]